MADASTSCGRLAIQQSSRQASRSSTKEGKSSCVGAMGLLEVASSTAGSSTLRHPSASGALRARTAESPLGPLIVGRSRASWQGPSLSLIRCKPRRRRDGLSVSAGRTAGGQGEGGRREPDPLDAEVGTGGASVVPSSCDPRRGASSGRSRPAAIARRPCDPPPRGGRGGASSLRSPPGAGHPRPLRCPPGRAPSPPPCARVAPNTRIRRRIVLIARGGLGSANDEVCSCYRFPRVPEAPPTR